MNLSRKKVYPITWDLFINPYWLLGFTEAEGTFGIKNLVPYFQICQHGRSLLVLEAEIY